MSVITIDGKSHSTAASIDYLRLVAKFPLRTIKTEAEYDRAAALVDHLALKPIRTRGENDYLDALVLFIEAYDDAHEHQMPRLNPLETLKALMEHRGMTNADLGKLIGSKGAASSILHGKRGISKTHMAKLAAHFRVDAGVFL